MLQVHPFDSATHEARLEAEIKRALSEHREESLGCTPTHWDNNLAFLLMPSLAAYEQEAVTGQPAASSDEFQQCIRRSIPAGYVFKGFPQHHRCSAHTSLYLTVVCLTVSCLAVPVPRLNNNALWLDHTICTAPMFMLHYGKVDRPPLA